MGDDAIAGELPARSRGRALVDLRSRRRGDVGMTAVETGARVSVRALSPKECMHYLTSLFTDPVWLGT